MICENCSASGDTRNVTFHQNIGMLFMRQSRTVQGRFCKRCINHYFWTMTMVGLVFGWWGIISFFVNILFIFGNIFQYLACLGMGSPKSTEPIPSGPQLARFSEERIAKYEVDLRQAIHGGEDLDAAFEQISDKAIVPVSQIKLYIAKYRLDE